MALSNFFLFAMNNNIKHIIESLLFVAGEPLSIKRMQVALDVDDTQKIKIALKSLEDEYEARKGGIFLSKVAGGYQIRSRAEYAQWITRLKQPTAKRFSNAALETLAVIAYKQPIIRGDVEHIRGVDCGGIIRMLLERGLVKIKGRKATIGKPLIYATTKKFLELFDLNDIKDIPAPIP